jgi:FkbM family methyltransferase
LVELSVSSGLGARFIAESGALDCAFVLVDVGVRGGIHPRWHALEPAMEVYGFDAIAEVDAPNARHHYFKLALGNYDGDCMLYVPDNLYEARVSAGGTHKVPIARLDTLWVAGTIPPADFIKIDCEGYEPEVLTGAAEYLQASNLLGADIESHFHVGTSLPYSHFAAVNTVLVDRQLRVADLALQSAHGFDQPWNGTCNVLFTRHLLDEHNSANRPEMDFSPTTILKTIAIFDVYGLVGPAVALTRKFRHVISRRLDADALHKKLILSPQVKAIEEHLPHLGLGLWTRAKRWLGR